MKDLIERDAAIKALTQSADYIADALERLEKVPTAEAVSAEAYDHLLHLAKAMHLWIFLNAIDEQEVYDELGFTDDDNALLESIGRPIVITDGEAKA